VASTWWRGFDEPLLLANEDAGLYRELQDRVHAAVQPVDIIEEMLIMMWCRYSGRFCAGTDLKRV
jgi:hypothetical protein